MEQVRHIKLDRVCESLGEVRDSRNRLAGEEGSLKTAALKFMIDARVDVYKHAGIALLREPGADKLHVRRAKDEDATGAADDGAGEGTEGDGE
jgi:hypothetical protein